jgi:ankyrin repeat protein
MWAVYYDQFNAVRFLIENGSDVNARSAKNYGSIAKDSTALIIASYYGNTRTAGLLLASGANPKIINTNKETAQTIAEQYGFAEITSLLTTGKTGQAKLASDALADSPVEKNVTITLNDSSKIDGIFISQTKTAITVKTKNGHMTFEKDRIWEFRFK